MSHSTSSFFSRNRFLSLFISFLLLFAISPFLEGAVAIETLLDILVTFILISAVYAISQRRRTQVIALVLAIPFFTARWALHVTDIVPLKTVGVLFGILFFGYIAVIVVIHLFTERTITPDLVVGSVCGYFLVGLMWSFVYAGIEIVSPGSLHLEQSGGHDLSVFSYYSFVTLTTVGYGDIIPVASPARNFAVLEAVIGQIYLTVLVARLVGMHISQSMRSGGNVN